MGSENMPLGHHTASETPTLGDSTAELQAWRRGVAKGEWARHRETIRRLYLGENRSLNGVMEIMRVQHDFTAS